MSSAKESKKIGILGGTFNPPHFAHIAMAATAVRDGGMDKVILIPNGDPPHKRLSVSSADRLMMTKLAAAETSKLLGVTDSGEPQIEVSDIEISRPGFSFLVNTLEELKGIYSDDRLFFIVGGDALMSISSWYGADRIFRLADILAFKREGGLNLNPASAVRYLEKRGAAVTLLDTRLPMISSSQIRELIKDGGDISGLVPESIAGYIIDKKLYT